VKYITNNKLFNEEDLREGYFSTRLGVYGVETSHLYVMMNLMDAINPIISGMGHHIVIDAITSKLKTIA